MGHILAGIAVILVGMALALYFGVSLSKDTSKNAAKERGA